VPADTDRVRTVERRQIECLACGAVRPASGTRALELGECPCCGYLGWAYADELDRETQRLIMNGQLARRRPAECGRRSAAAIVASPRA
jgi:hypothetical protein